MSKKYGINQEVAHLYRAAFIRAQAANEALVEARDKFTAVVPVGQTVLGFRHIRVHNLEPKIEVLKAEGLWRKVAEMQVSMPKLRDSTKGWSLRKLKTISKIVTHHRVLDVRKAAK